MKFVEPKCPSCQKSFFGYKRIPEAGSIFRLNEDIRIKQEDIASHPNDPVRNKKCEKKILINKNALQRLLDHPQISFDTEAFLIFCLSCGTIIGTGGGPHLVVANR